MKLYETPPRTWVRVEPDPDGPHRVPPAAPLIDHGEEIFFDHVDGMYSYCLKADGTVCHLAAWTEVEPLEEQRPRP